MRVPPAHVLQVAPVAALVIMGAFFGTHLATSTATRSFWQLVEWTPLILLSIWAWLQWPRPKFTVTLFCVTALVLMVIPLLRRSIATNHDQAMSMRHEFALPLSILSAVSCLVILFRLIKRVRLRHRMESNETTVAGSDRGSILDILVLTTIAALICGYLLPAFGAERSANGFANGHRSLAIHDRGFTIESLLYQLTAVRQYLGKPLTYAVGACIACITAFRIVRSSETRHNCVAIALAFVPLAALVHVTLVAGETFQEPYFWDSRTYQRLSDVFRSLPDRLRDWRQFLTASILTGIYFSSALTMSRCGIHLSQSEEGEVNRKSMAVGYFRAALLSVVAALGYQALLSVTHLTKDSGQRIVDRGWPLTVSIERKALASWLTSQDLHWSWPAACFNLIFFATLCFVA